MPHYQVNSTTGSFNLAGLNLSLEATGWSINKFRVPLPNTLNVCVDTFLFVYTIV